MTSGHTFPQRLTEIDDLTRGDHRYLAAGDVCHFIGEYTARRGFAYSATNSLILDFKKPVARAGRPEWRYKEAAIAGAAAVLRGRCIRASLDRLVFVPVPPSKARDAAAYDDRLVRMLRMVRPQQPLDVRELIVAGAQHGGGASPGGTAAAAGAAGAAVPHRRGAGGAGPGVVAVVDDLLTTGAHFRAAATVLKAAFPDIDVVGLFLARRVPDTTAPEAMGEGTG